MAFRDRLLATLRAIAPLFEEPGVMIGGSEVPNLLEPGAASTLVVSQDVDVVVPVERHAAVKRRLHELEHLRPSAEEPSVWVPATPELLEVNFIGRDAKTRDAGDTYLFEDPELPLLVFGLLSLLVPGEPVRVGGMSVPVPKPAGLLLEKLLTERSGEKGDRDLLVALGLLLVAGERDLDELESLQRALPAEQRRAVLSGLATLSLIGRRAEMPDPESHRPRVAALRARLERREP